MVVELPSEAALAQLQSVEKLGVQLHFDDYSYRVMLDALHHVAEAKGNRLATLRDIFHTATPLSWAAPSAMPLRLPWLNASQEEAVRDVLRAKDVLIVHGPPGTGKTTTLVEAVSEVLRREPQVLVCAQSNTAVDWMCAQLSQRGISVLRIGNPNRVTPEMLANTYEHRFESHPDYPDLWQIRRNIRQLYSQPHKSRSENFHQKISRLRERADELEMRIRHNLFDQSRVIACTLTGAAHQLLMGQHFHTLFIDEAAQALEAACWIALQKADRVIFAGDHQQRDALTTKGDTYSSKGLEPLVLNGVLTDMKMYICPSTSVKVATYSSKVTSSPFMNNDASTTGAGSGLSALGLSYHYLPGMNANTTGSDSGIVFDGGSGSGNASPNHDKFGNILFGDGHVASFVSGAGNNYWTKKTNWTGTVKNGSVEITGNAVTTALGTKAETDGTNIVD